jgi:ABC-type uncharacterized transport system permease subunit
MFPVMLVVTRTLPVNVLTWLIFSATVLFLDVVLWRLALRAFDRERAISTA